MQQWPGTMGCHCGNIKYVKFAIDTTRCFGRFGFSKIKWKRSCWVKMRFARSFFAETLWSLSLPFLWDLLLGPSSKSYSSSAWPLSKMPISIFILLSSRRNTLNSISEMNNTREIIIKVMSINCKFSKIRKTNGVWSCWIKLSKLKYLIEAQKTYIFNWKITCKVTCLCHWLSEVF